MSQQWPPPGQNPQGPYGGPPPGNYPPPGFIALTIQGSALTSNMITPTVLIDGRTVPAAYGQNTYPVPPGQHRVELYAQWLRRYGQAAMDVNVAVGQSVPVFYRAPLHQFTTGSIGHTKQTAKGKGALYGILAFVVLVLLIVVVLAVVAS